MRILFSSVPLAGHFFPMVPLAWAFRALGHEVLVATPANFVRGALTSGLPVVPSGPETDLVPSVPADPAEAEHGLRLAHGRLFGRIALAALPGTEALFESWRPDLHIGERAEFAGPLAAAARGVPSVEVHWGVAKLDEYRLGATEILADELATRGAPALPEPARVLNPWPASLRLPHAATHHDLRHVSFNGEALVPEWALRPSGRARICLTLGTIVPHLERSIAGSVVDLVRELATLGAEVVVAVDDAVAARWPALPAAVRYAGRLPLAELLRVSSVAIHHGGQGTTLTALAAGCPQLVLPQFDDQFENAEAVVRAGGGTLLRPGRLTPDAVAKACLDLLDTVRFQLAAAEVAGEIAAQPTPFDVAGALRHIA